jgi:hypothetical protein
MEASRPHSLDLAETDLVSKVIYKSWGISSYSLCL